MTNLVMAVFIFELEIIILLLLGWWWVCTRTPVGEGPSDLETDPIKAARELSEQYENLTRHTMELKSGANRSDHSEVVTEALEQATIGAEQAVANIMSHRPEARFDAIEGFARLLGSLNMSLEAANSIQTKLETQPLQETPSTGNPEPPSNPSDEPPSQAISGQPTEAGASGVDSEASTELGEQSDEKATPEAVPSKSESPPGDDNSTDAPSDPPEANMDGEPPGQVSTAQPSGSEAPEESPPNPPTGSSF